MTDAQHLSWLRLSIVAVAIVFFASACNPETPAPSATPEANVETVAVQQAVTAVEQLDDGFSCGEPVQRADDFAWICEGSRQPATVTIHLYATDVDAALFGVTIYSEAPSSQSEEAAAQATEDLALDVIESTVPQAWREAVAVWVTDHMPDGGRTLDVPDAGVTASVQPLTALQWYLELYELDGVTPGSEAAG